MPRSHESSKALLRENEQLRMRVRELMPSFSLNKGGPKVQLFQIALVLEEAREAIVVVQDNQHKYVNKRVTEITGYSAEELCNTPLSKTIHPEDLPKVISKNKKRLEGHVVKYNYRVLDRQGEVKWLESVGTKIFWEGKPATLCFITDLTDRIKSEKELKKKSLNLEETNTALQVLLKIRQKDIHEIEEKILKNVKELILPYIEKLKKHTVRMDSAIYVDILEKNINEIVSPFLMKMSHQYANLTPREIQIAALVKEGRTTKEISGILNIAVETVNKNRKNIRRKIQLKNKTDNLRSRLLSLHLDG